MSCRLIPGERMVRRVVLLVGLSVLGCDGGTHVDLPKDQVWSSPHFRYAARAEDANVCGPVVDQLEAHLQALSSYLGLDWTGGVIDYYKFRDQDDLHASSGCPPAAHACALPADVRSTRALDGHELIHVYTAPLGRPPALFQEGLATALAPEGRAFMAPSQSWREIIASPPLPSGAWPDVDYTGGAWLITYLLRTFGPSPFLAFYRAMAPADSADEVAARFTDVYGLDLDGVWNQAQIAFPRLSGIPIWECASASPLTLGADLPVGDTCDGHGAFAALESPTSTILGWSADSKLDFSISTCGADAPFFALFDDYWHQPGAVGLPAGRFYVASGQQHVATKLGLASGVLGPECGSLAPLVLGPEGVSPMIVVTPSGTDPWYAMPQSPGSTVIHLSDYPANQRPFGEVAATAEACDTCAGPCHALDAGSDTELSTGMVLRFTNLTSFEGAAVARLLYTW
jgi:hypothetical protein